MLQQLRSVVVGAVYCGDEFAGRLVRSEAGTRFEYAPGWAGPPVATTLPLKLSPHIGPAPGAVPAFFAGLLPEGRRLSAIHRALKTSADDELSLLLAVGSDTIGWVRVIPEGKLSAEAPAYPVAAPLESASFDELFAMSVGREPADRVGLPGVQSKVSSGMISLPLAYRGHSYILKLTPPEFPHLVENEAFFLTAAAESGIRVAPHTVIFDRTGASGLLVTRFDRVHLAQGPCLRLAQEDAVQVSNLHPADKYRLSTEEAIGALAACCPAPVAAAYELSRQFAFAYLTCNGDAHGKNFSVLRANEEWGPSPAYDVLTTHPYGDTTMALQINGKLRENIGRADFVALGKSVGIRPRAIERMLDRLLKRTHRWLPRLSELPFDKRRLHKLERAITYRAKRLGA